MDDQKKPRSRVKKVVNDGKGVEIHGEGLGTGPVNNMGNYSDRKEQEVRQTAKQPQGRPQVQNPFGQQNRPQGQSPVPNRYIILSASRTGNRDRIHSSRTDRPLPQAGANRDSITVR